MGKDSKVLTRQDLVVGMEVEFVYGCGTQQEKAVVLDTGMWDYDYGPFGRPMRHVVNGQKIEVYASPIDTNKSPFGYDDRVLVGQVNGDGIVRHAQTIWLPGARATGRVFQLNEQMRWVLAA